MNAERGTRNAELKKGGASLLASLLCLFCLLHSAFAQEIYTAQGLASFGKKTTSGGGGGSYVLVNHTAAALGGSGGTSSGINTSGSTFIVVGVVFHATLGTMSDSKGNTWTPLTTSANSGTRACKFYYCENPTVGSGHTFSTTADLSGIFVLCFSGNAASPFDQQSGHFNDTSGTFTGGSVTPTQNNEIVVSLMGYFADPSTAQPITINSGFTKVDSIDWGGGANLAGGIAWLQQGTAGAVDPTWALAGGTADGVAANATFK